MEAGGMERYLVQMPLYSKQLWVKCSYVYIIQQSYPPTPTNPKDVDTVEVKCADLRDAVFTEAMDADVMKYVNLGQSPEKPWM